MLVLWNLCWSVGVCLAIGQAPPATLPSVQPSARGEVASLLAEARQALSSAEAMMILREVEARLETDHSEIQPIHLKYLEGDLARTRGSIAYQQSRESHGESSRLVEARRQFQRALEAFTALDALCVEEIEAIEKERGRRDVTRHRGWNEAQEYRLRAQYASGWVHYQLGLCYESEVDRKLHFVQGIEAFSDFVMSGYFRNPVVVESHLGMSLCLLELGRFSEVIELLEEASRSESPSDLYAPIVLAKVRAWHALADYEHVIEASQELLGRRNPEGSLSGTELQILMLETDALAKTLKIISDEKARQERWDRCVRLMEALYGRGEPVRGELLRTLGRNEVDTAIGRLAEATALYRSGHRPEAIDVAWRGLKLVEVVEDDALQRALHADFLQVLVALHWELERWREVHDLACAFIRQYAEDPRAADVCLRGIHGGLVAMDADPPLPETTFFDCLSVARQRFPDLEEAQKGDWYRAIRLLGEGRYQAAVDVLEKTTAASPSWREAQYGLAFASAHLVRQEGGRATTRPEGEV